jgi:hypothetical protein
MNAPFHEPFDVPPGFGVRRFIGAFIPRAGGCKSGDKSSHSKRFTTAKAGS